MDQTQVVCFAVGKSMRDLNMFVNHKNKGD